MVNVIKNILSYSGGVLCEVILTKDYAIAPKLTSEWKSDGSIISKPLEDLYPFLERDELYSNMIVKDKNKDPNKNDNKSVNYNYLNSKNNNSNSSYKTPYIISHL